MTTPMKKMIIGLVVVFGGLVLFNIVRKLMTEEMMSHFQPPPMVISADYAKLELWQPFVSSVGTLQAVNGVAVTTESPGIITAINFQSGQFVKQGQLLIRIDDSVERADLENNQAQLKLAQLNYNRQKDLVRQKAAPQSALDEAQANLIKAQAAVDRSQALINQKNIVAPFDGKLGIRLVNLGQFVSAGTQFVSLQSLNPLYANFSLPEQYLKSVYVNQPVVLQINAYPNQTFSGQITAINSTSTVTTHNIDIQATIPNDHGYLYPGLFTNIKVIFPTKQQVITVPQTSISSSLFGDSIFIIKEEGKDKNNKPVLKVNREYVVTGEQRGDRVAITQGIKAGNRVVTSGQLKLNDGTRVVIDANEKLPVNQNLTP